MMHDGRKILVADNERNNRSNIVRTLEARGFDVESVGTGEEALHRLGATPFDLLFLDLKMPGLDGMDVLRRTRTTRPQVKVVVVTAHGTIDSAVEAMRLGAADFLQKPFSAEEIAEVAARVLLPGPGDANPENYARCLSEAREAILRHELPAAEAAVRKAIGIDPTKPEAFNLLGVTAHLSGRRYPAQNYFRAALALDGSYRPSHRNLERSVDGGVRGVHMEMDLGDDDGKDH